MKPYGNSTGPLSRSSCSHHGRSSPFTASLLLAVASVQGCATLPPSADGVRGEPLSVLLDENRPLQIPRWEVDRYTCGPGVAMVCDAATRLYLLCRCPFVR